MSPAGQKSAPPAQSTSWLSRFSSEAFGHGARRATELYVLWAAVLVLGTARRFYGSMRLQTEQALLWFEPHALEDLISGARRPSWSAPLDDVFIHFDFARSVATGAPFEWTPGGGYSSGGTSLFYPFLLALGERLGYDGLELMHFAAIVATVGTFGALLGLRRMFSALPGPSSFLLPVAFLSVGALSWTLYSGMEVAVFLAAYALCVVLWDDLLQLIERDPENASALRGAAVRLGLGGFVLLGFRPEAAPLVAIFGAWPALVLFRRRAFELGSVCLIAAGAPAALLLGAHLWLNHHFTGSTAAAGALAKLELHHPYLTGSQVWDSWKHFVVYQVERLSGHHFSAVPGVGYAVTLLAALALCFERTRRSAILLWLSLLTWTALVALNGQVRWQNERYAMPTAAWLLTGAALGIAGAADFALRRIEARAARLGFLVGLASLCVAFYLGQAPRYRDQTWFFGRASRNILEQHVRAGTYLGFGLKPRPRRVLLSDAGALPYASDLPAFDLIGLGGYRGLPIAEASRQGVGGVVELLQRLGPTERPDVMALYPGWWGTFVLWFGAPHKDFPVRGNVICGGASKVIYTPDWAPLEGAETLLHPQPGSRVVDRIDVADLVSEREHGVRLDREASGFIDMKILPHPEERKRGVWDAGRLLTAHMGLSLTPQARASRILLRVAPAQPATVAVEWPGGGTQPIDIAPRDAWTEVSVPLPSAAFRDLAAARLTVRVLRGELIVYHLFLLEEQ